jgi:hypothetical protein
LAAEKTTARVVKEPDNTAFLTEIERIAVEALRPAAERMAQSARSNLGAANRSDSGDLTDSIEVLTPPDGESGLDVWATAAYAIYVELGREPGRKAPPVNVMRSWVKRRLGLSGDEADRAAYLIGQAISEGGIPATHFMRDAGQSVPLEDIRRAVEEALND